MYNEFYDDNDAKENQNKLNKKEKIIFTTTTTHNNITIIIIIIVIQLFRTYHGSSVSVTASKNRLYPFGPNPEVVVVVIVVVEEDEEEEEEEGHKE